MRAHLMSPDRDEAVPDGSRGFLWHPSWAPGSLFPDLRADLQLDVLLDAAAGGDPLVREACEQALLHPVVDPAIVRHRQAAVRDCLAHPDLLAALRGLAADGLQAERDSWWMPLRSRRPSVEESTRTLRAQLAVLVRLRDALSACAREVRSDAFRALVDVARRELDEAWLVRAGEVLDAAGSMHAVLVEAGLGPGGATVDLVPRLPERTGRLFPRIVVARPSADFEIPDRDEAGFQALSRFTARVLARTETALAESVDHLHRFFAQLRWEAAFLQGCANLEGALRARGSRTCDAAVEAPGGAALDATGLYDPCLVLRTGAPAVPNDVDGRGRGLLVITGANHGGKTTLLRALGVAQLLAGAGMPVPAESLRISLAPSVRTHWSRPETGAGGGGKFDEELARMSALVDDLRAGSLLLSNESFSSTNEAEGSRIGADVIEALVGSGVRVAAVTHLVTMARELEASGVPAVFLRAGRGEGGERPYRLTPGGPLATSYAEDLWAREFATARVGSPTAAGPDLR